MKLGQICLLRGWISPQQLEIAIALQQAYQLRLGEFLLCQGWISQSQLQQALQEQYWRQNGYGVID